MARMSDRRDDDSISAALAIFGDRWSLLILRAVFRGLHRFGEMRDDLGIASNLLTTRLAALVDDGILERTEYQQRPQRFEYRLTDAGRDLSPVLISIMQWGDTHRMSGNAPTRLVHLGCDGLVENQTVCGSCGLVLHADEIRSNHSEFAGDTT